VSARALDRGSKSGWLLLLGEDVGLVFEKAVGDDGKSDFFDRDDWASGDEGTGGDDVGDIGVTVEGR